MNQQDDWANWGEQWRQQPQVAVDRLRRRVRWKRWRMMVFVVLELLLSLCAVGQLLWLLAHPQFPLRLRLWALGMMPFVVITQVLLLHIRRGGWAASGDTPRALLALMQRRARAGIRLAKLYIWSNLLQALASVLCFAPELESGRWLHDPRLRKLVVVNATVNALVLVALLAACFWYIRRQRRRIANVDAVLAAADE